MTSSADTDPDTLKRTRRACIPCRRKKSKCSGDRPACTTCSRLRHRCSYHSESPRRQAGNTTYPLSSSAATAPPPLDHSDGGDRGAAPASTRTSTDPTASSFANDGSPWETRFLALESTLAEVVQALKSGPAAGGLLSQTDSRDEAGRQPQQQQQRSQSRRDLGDIVSGGAIASSSSLSVPQAAACSSSFLTRSHPQLWKHATLITPYYLEFCDSQPLPLFHTGSFIESLSSRSDEVLLSILVVAGRFAEDPKSLGVSPREVRGLSNSAHALVMKKIGEGQISLGIIQALCLLALKSFHDGPQKMAIPLISLASSLANGTDVLHQPHYPNEIVIEETKRCFWSVVLLERIFGCPSAMTSTHLSVAPPEYPYSPALPGDVPMSVGTPQHVDLDDTSNGVVVVTLRLGEAWSKTMAYTKKCFYSVADVSPWLPTSKYTEAMSFLMDLSHEIAPHHRYRNFPIRELSEEDLRRHRDYWAPWFLSRFMYHTIVCLLNHPLLITMQLQGRRSRSELFLQQTSFHVSHHVKWILHLVSYIKSRNFRISDPVIGYCAAVVATIELQLSFSAQGAHREQKAQNVLLCQDFIRSLKEWPSMQLLADKLEGAAEAISVSYESNISSPDGNMHVDLTKLFSILNLSVMNMPDGQGVGEGLPEDSPLAGTSVSGQYPSRVELLQLPSITQPDQPSTHDDHPMSMSSAQRVSGYSAGSGHSDPSGGQFESQAQMTQQSGLVLPADSFFGSFPQDGLGNWWLNPSADNPQLDM